MHSLPQGGMAAEAIRFFGLDASVPGPSPATPTATPTAAGACRVAVTTSAWNTGLTANVTITNTGPTTVGGWTLAFTLRPGQAITSGWSATYSPASGAVRATNAAYNGTLAPGASTTIGYQASHTGDSGPPGLLQLNGSPCSVV